MGTPIPNEEFYIDPAKSYDVVTYAWVPWPAPPQCGINYVRTFACIKTGQQVLDWLNAGHECTLNVLCAIPLAGFCEKIKSMTER